MSFYVTVTNLADHAHDVPIQPERARQHLIEEHGCGDIRRMKISPDEALERDLEYHDYLHKADDAALPDSMMNEPVHDPDEEERIDRIWHTLTIRFAERYAERLDLPLTAVHEWLAFSTQPAHGEWGWYEYLPDCR